MLRTRVLSALVLAPVAVAAIYFGDPVFDLFIVAAAIVMVWEWATITGQGRFGAAGLALVAVIVGNGIAVYFGWPAAVVPILIAGAMVTAGIAKWAGHARPIWAGAGALYIGLPTAALMWLRGLPADGLLIVIWLFVVVWATDIGAYFAGRTIGGPKLAPRISPNKTWAGLGGGILLAAIMGSAVAAWGGLSDVFIPALAGGFLAIVAQIGDLAESAIKRKFEVKDSSHIIPGHGGLLDRLDGVIAVAPTVVFVNWISGGKILIWQ